MESNLEELKEEKLNSKIHENVELVIDDGRIESLGEFISPEELFSDLISRVQKYHPSTDVSMIEKAYKIANEAHVGQVRKSGEPYIIHPLYVAIILADLELDKETICAGILHDVVEDTILTKEEIEAEFGPDVALLVDGVTKLKSFGMADHSSQLSQDKEKVEVQAENLRKMFLAMAKDIRVILVKLADRLHNMRTLGHMPPEKQQRIARETLDIYSPIADRLGISKIKVELDDLSLKYLEPEAYKELTRLIAVRKSDRERYIQNIVNEVSAHIKDAGIDAKIDGRVKHFFSIYKKMVNQNKSIDQIYDLFAIRIIVKDIRDCYAALGAIHEIYKPIPGRFKDYIAMPKPNNYQSLHTTLIGNSSPQPFEIQIRTEEMHKAAEFGIAAHWKYKEASDGKKVVGGEEEKLAWLRQVLEWQKEMSDNKEFLDVLKSDFDIFNDSVYAFTPNGEVKNLPAGSTPIDFAYSIHSAVGNKMVGARVNGQLVTIDYVIKTGDRVEIITSQNSKGPSRDWLNIVKSTQAKNKISQWFKAEYKEENISRGKDAFLGYCKARNIIPTDILVPEYMDFITHKYGFHDWDAVLAAIGHGGLKEGQIINKMLELLEAERKKNMTDEEILESVNETAKMHPKMHSGKSGIIVKGIDDVAVRFSKCCSPVPGDEIVGFVTRGRGISIHRTDCINVISLPEADRVRFIDAEWQNMEKQSSKYTVEIRIFANNRNGLLADISRALTERNISIISLNTRVNKQGIVTMITAFEIESTEELNRVVEKIRNIDSVMDIERTRG